MTRPSEHKSDALNARPWHSKTTQLNNCTKYSQGDIINLLYTTYYCASSSDNEPPVLQCPADITVDVFTHQQGATVNYTTVNATDNVDVVTPNCNIASGTYFQIGSNSITCFARDEENNAEFCTFQVIVRGEKKHISFEFGQFSSYIKQPPCILNNSSSCLLSQWKQYNTTV